MSIPTYAAPAQVGSMKSMVPVWPAALDVRTVPPLLAITAVQLISLMEVSVLHVRPIAINVPQPPHVPAAQQVIMSVAMELDVLLVTRLYPTAIHVLMHQLAPSVIQGIIGTAPNVSYVHLQSPIAKNAAAHQPVPHATHPS